MAPKIYKTSDPVTLDGFQAILRPSEYGYTLTTSTTDESLIEALQAEREELLTGLKGKLKNPKRSVEKPEPWEEVAQGVYKLKFGWDAKGKPTIVDAEGTLVTDDSLPLYSGSRVRIAFIQKPYTLKDGVTYGTAIKLSGIQIISLNSTGIPSLSEEEAGELFGSFDGGYSVDDVPPAGTDDNGEFEPSDEDVPF